VADTKPIVINFPNTGGIRVSIKNVPSKNKYDAAYNSSPIYFKAELPINRFIKDFNPSKLNYNAREYYDIAIRTNFGTFDDLIYGALNSLPRNTKKSSSLVLIDSINRFYKSNITYPEKLDSESLSDIIRKQTYKLNRRSSQELKQDLFYDMFIHSDEESESIKKLNRFFKNANPLTDDITKFIDELRILSIEIGMNPEETLEIPAKIATEKDKKGALKYPLNTIDAKLDFKNKNLTMTLKSNLRRSIILTDALKSQVSTVQNSKGITTTEKWLPVKNEMIIVEEFIIIVTEKSVKVSVRGNSATYKLLENSNN
jgi:hypothetical protein